jgi:ABC-type nitrate/sulfonate/bicarbonate transport system permease component
MSSTTALGQTEVLGSGPADADIEEVTLADDTGKRRIRLIRIASVVVVIGGWEIAGRHVNQLYMSYPSAIVRAGWGMTTSGQLISALGSSARALLLGFLIASVLGVALGMFIGRYRSVEAATDWLVNALYATPLVALVPLVILWFGLGFRAKLFIVVIMAIFPVLINTASGVRNVSQAMVDVGRAFVANERRIFIPAALPYIMTGRRLGIGRAIIGMVVAEFLTGISGLGALVITYGNSFRTDAMLVPVILLMVIGVLLSALLRWAEARIAPWKEDQQS